MSHEHDLKALAQRLRLALDIVIPGTRTHDAITSAADALERLSAERPGTFSETEVRALLLKSIEAGRRSIAYNEQVTAFVETPAAIVDRFLHEPKPDPTPEESKS
jgi:hypothetical protein